jgi:hypothetical protein
LLDITDIKIGIFLIVLIGVPSLTAFVFSKNFNKWGEVGTIRKNSFLLMVPVQFIVILMFQIIMFGKNDIEMWKVTGVLLILSIPTSYSIGVLTEMKYTQAKKRK